MTVIASILNGGELFAFSDILLSVPVQTQHRPTWLPMFQHPVTQLSDLYNAAGVEQKSVQLGPNHLFQWTGNRLLAREALRLAHENVCRAYGLDLLQLFDKLGLNPENSDELAIIFHSIDGNRLTREQIGCMTALAGDSKAWFAGSGAYHSMLDPVIESGMAPIGPPELTFFGHTLFRLMSCVSDELTSHGTLAFAYGGWFEIARIQNDRIEKIPYCIKLWEIRDNGLVVDLPIIASHYLAEHLAFSRFNPRTQDPMEVYVVPDPLMRSTPPTREQVLAADLDDRVQVHLAWWPEERAFIVSVKTDPTDVRMRFDAGSKVVIELEQTFVRELLSAMDETNLNLKFRRNSWGD